MSPEDGKHQGLDPSHHRAALVTCLNLAQSAFQDEAPCQWDMLLGWMGWPEKGGKPREGLGSPWE